MNQQVGNDRQAALDELERRAASTTDPRILKALDEQALQIAADLAFFWRAEG